MAVEIARLAETEYVAVADPTRTQQTRFGRFIHTPRFPMRRDPNQLFDVRGAAGEFEALVDEVERLYQPTGLSFYKLSGHDLGTWRWLAPVLESRGWSVKRTWMMMFVEAPKRKANSEVRIEVVESATSEDLRRVNYHPGTDPSGVPFRIAQDARLGGEVLLAYLDDDPVGTTGWFVVDGVARYRGVLTVPGARGRGVATTMIRYVQEHPTVRSQDALTIHVGEDGPVSLYEALGFARQGLMWEAVKFLSDNLPSDE